MTQENYFERYGGTAPENYQRYFVPAIGAPLAADLVEEAQLRPAERVLDVACGTGVATRLAAERVGAEGRATGVDINAGMVAVARSATPEELAIDWHEARAEQLPFPDGAFDAVLCALSLQFFDDKPAALREMRRVLAPRGRLHVSVPGAIPPVFAVLAEELARHIQPALAGFVQAVFSLPEAGELARLIEGAGFAEVSARVEAKTLRVGQPEQFLWGYVVSTPLAAAVAQASADARDALQRDVMARWQPFVDDDELRLDLTGVVAAATKP